MTQQSADIYSSGMVVMAVLAIAFGYLAWQQNALNATARTEPTEVPLTALTRVGAGGNRHVIVTGVRFANNHYVVARTSGVRVRRVVVIQDAEGNPRALFRSIHTTNDDDFQKLQSQDSLHALAVSDVESLPPDQEEYVKRSGLRPDSVPILSDDFRPLDRSEFWLYVFITGLSAVACPTLYLLYKRAERRRAAEWRSILSP